MASWPTRVILALPRSHWRLPGFFMLRGRRAPLTYHGRPDRWTRSGDYCFLRSVGRGQEFVIDGDEYPEVEEWARRLIETGRRRAR